MTDPRWRTALSGFDEESIHIGGYRVRDLMRHVDFGGALFVLCQGRLPSVEESKLLNAVLVSVLDHGIVAPSAVARIVAASGVPLQACVAAGIMTIGDVHGGAGEQVARQLGNWVAEVKAASGDIANKARSIVAEARASKRRLDGFGHPLHPREDERVDTMVDLARELDLMGPHLELVLAIAAEIEVQSGRRIPPNVDGAMAGVLMDLGFDWRLVRLFVFVPRAAGIAAHAVEEVVREKGWRVVARKDEVEYDGPPLRSLERG